MAFLFSIKKLQKIFTPQSLVNTRFLEKLKKNFQHFCNFLLKYPIKLYIFV